MHVRHIARPVRRLLPACLAALLLTACATQPGRPVWGADVTLTPGWSRVGNAAVKAATDPFTWAPLAGALALQIGDADGEIADWANRHTPIFGSRSNASDASDWLRKASYGVYAAAAVAAPVGAGEDAVVAKFKGLAVGAATLALTSKTTGLLKQATGRERPLGQNDRSLPSRHASLSAASMRLTHETLRYYDLSPGQMRIADLGLVGLTGLTGWARVEAGAHHPADILAGAALGNFLAVFFNEAFLHPALGPGMALDVESAGDGLMLGATVAF